jgi:hypothetical protein
MERVNKSAGVISHGWLSSEHPDPEVKRRADIGKVHRDALFWDFPSLYQAPRTATEEASFQIALRSLHNVYGHPRWTVYRLLTVPESAQNPVPYLRRGWCVFQSAIAIVGSGLLETIQGGKSLTDAIASPVPLTPARFEMMSCDCHFTVGTDRDILTSLYKRIFPKLAEHEKYEFFGWGDSQVREFLEVLPALTGAKEVRITNSGHGCQAELSAEMRAELTEALMCRGGGLEVC